MYAIFKRGSKQYRVQKGDVIDVDLMDLEEDAKDVEFSDVIFVNDGQEIRVGAPLVEGFIVKGEVVGAKVKGEKIISYKFKRRKNYHRKIGHRQKYTRVKITDIASA